MNRNDVERHLTKIINQPEIYDNSHSQKKKQHMYDLKLLSTRFHIYQPTIMHSLEQQKNSQMGRDWIATYPQARLLHTP